jgi:RecA-family ATPase
MADPERVNWLLAPNYLVAGRANLLVGEEGIGKSMWTIQALAAVTTGRAWGPFIASEPRDAIIIATEDGWSDTVRPRLEVAGADLDRVYVFSERDDGEGSPLFPAHMPLLRSYDMKPALVVVDSWIDTVPGGLNVKDTQQCREAMRPWKSYAADTGAAVLLVTHVNRMASPNARDTYELSAGLRQVARSAIYVIRDGDELVAGPEKSNHHARADVRPHTGQ